MVTYRDIDALSNEMPVKLILPPPNLEGGSICCDRNEKLELVDFAQHDGVLVFHRCTGRASKEFLVAEVVAHF